MQNWIAILLPAAMAAQTTDTRETRPTSIAFSFRMHEARFHEGREVRLASPPSRGETYMSGKRTNSEAERRRVTSST